MCDIDKNSVFYLLGKVRGQRVKTKFLNEPPGKLFTLLMECYKEEFTKKEEYRAGIKDGIDLVMELRRLK